MEKESKVQVIIIDRGPIIIKGNYEIIDRDGGKIILTELQKLNGLALCRCGRSKNQPYCDGSHAK